MDTILASIRRIILEDEAGAATGPTGAADEDDEVLVLEPSMMVRPATQEQPMSNAMPSHPASSAAQTAAAQTAADLAAALFDDEPAPAPAPPTAIVVSQPAAPPPVPAEIMPRPTHALNDVADGPLIAPQTRLAAVQALAALQEAVKPEPPPPGLMLHRAGGLSLEDMVRDELRGQLKLWLDENLPALVERVVRQEIESLVRPG